MLVAALGALALLTLGQLLLAVLTRGRRNGVRITLLVVSVLEIPVLLIAQVLLATPRRYAVLVQAVLMVTAVVLMVLPESNAWFRRRTPSTPQSL